MHLESTHALSGEQHSLMGSPASSTSQIPPGETHVEGAATHVEVTQISPVAQHKLIGSPASSNSHMPPAGTHVLSLPATGIEDGLAVVAVGADVSFPAATGIDVGPTVGAEVVILNSGSGT